jgi:hypothetical protein
MMVLSINKPFIQIKTNSMKKMNTIISGNFTAVSPKEAPAKSNYFTIKMFTMLLVLLVSACISYAQQSPKNAIKINPLSLLVKTGNVSYERAVGKKQSVQVGAFYSSLSLGDLNYQGYGVTPEFRFYINSANTLNGMYVAPFGRYQNFSLHTKGSSDKAIFTTVGGGATMGWQKSWESGFLLNLFAGPSFNEVTFKNKTQQDDYDLKAGMKGFGIRSGISLGFTF